MSILERLERDYLDAYKAKKAQWVSVFRLMRNALKNQQIDVGHTLSDEEATQALRTMVKQGEDALKDFERGGRQDLVKKQQEELELLARYLPADMPQEELESIIREVLTQAEQKNFGKVMGVVMKKVAGRVDGNRVKEVVQRMIWE